MSMSEKAVHWSFWLLASVALIWNLLGAINFLVQMDAEMLANYRESEQMIIENRPLWATLGFAVAVFAGALASLLLLLRKAIASYVFMASFVGLIVTMLHSLGSGIQFGMAEIIGIILMPIALAGFLIWYSKHCEKKGWLS